MYHYLKKNLSCSQKKKEIKNLSYAIRKNENQSVYKNISMCLVGVRR